MEISKRGKLLRELYNLREKQKKINIEVEVKEEELKKLDTNLDVEQYLGKNFIVYNFGGYMEENSRPSCTYYIKNVTKAEVWLNSGDRPPEIRLEADFIINDSWHLGFNYDYKHKHIILPPDTLKGSEVSREKLKESLAKVLNYIQDIINQGLEK